MATVWKMEILIIDHEGTSQKDIEAMLRQMRHISAQVMTAESKQIKWDDSLPINNIHKWKEAATELFRS